ncbi:hypothetical protein IC757_09305 [Wenzhouxiangella sp. AB-CW3]|uniref:hypothetical protein n=1 Tax=Wenzhouxiangella sp. AB-CW3 TaxID=2771012 RepID=UPI00168BB1DE|nr:hypothetical protein [Wenzhouxiangella sp. AB-CW3]QOC21252.1 hypothetical protein IC757_09305 [Wenzhouxiangella sp. AB-CW3]
MFGTTKGKLIWGVVFLAMIGTAAADVLLIEKVRERMARNLPDNGLSMSQVEQRFGEPLERRPAVGEPPITRWDYEDYSVFFEHELVIESVVHHEAVVREAERRNSP